VKKNWQQHKVKRSLTGYACTDMLLHIKLVVCCCKVNHSTNIACIKLGINFLEPYENIQHTEENSK